MANDLSILIKAKLDEALSTWEIKSQYIKSKNHFCSNECRKKFQKKDNVIYKCDNCKKEMDIKGYIYKELLEGKRKNIFCSVACKGNWESINRAGENNRLYDRVKLNCQFCQKEYSIPRNREP